jgi:predicted cupin superfamily sugar epimerase
MKNQEILLCCHDNLNATILLYPEGNRVGRMVGHHITREESHQIMVPYILLLITLSKIFKIVSISCHDKKTILAQVVEFETFTLSAHEVLGCWCSLVPWWQCGWRKGLSFLGGFYLEVVLMF